MRKILFGIAFSFACFASATAIAAPPAKDDPNRQVCKRGAATDGDRIVKRICHTAAEWDAQAEADRKAAELFDSRRNKFDPSTTSDRTRDGVNPALLPQTNGPR